MNTDFPVTIYLDEDGTQNYWVAEYLDLPGCIGVGKNPHEALEEAVIFKDMWIEAALNAGKVLPIPRNTYSKEYSGKFNQRVSKDLHRRLAIEAELQGVSMNSLCESYLERGLVEDKNHISKNPMDSTTESKTEVASNVGKDSTLNADLRSTMAETRRISRNTKRTYTNVDQIIKKHNL